MHSPTLLRLTLRFHELGMRSSLRRTRRRLQRTQRQLERVEKERQRLLLRWSSLDSSLQKQEQHREEWLAPLPPSLRTLEAYLAEREKARELQVRSLAALQELSQQPLPPPLLLRVQESAPEPTPRSLPSSMLRPRASSSPPSDPSVPAP